MKLFRRIAAALVVAALSVPAFAVAMTDGDDTKKQETAMVGED